MSVESTTDTSPKEDDFVRDRFYRHHGHNATDKKFHLPLYLFDKY